MQQIRNYMAKRDLERMGLLGVNLACIATVVVCIASIM